MGILGIARTVGKVADNAADAAKAVARNKAVTGLMTKAEDAIPSAALTKAIDDIPTQPVTRQVSNAEYDSAWSSFEDINTPEEWQSAVKKTVAGDRDITGNSPIRRTPELEASAKKLIDDKLITREEHLANIAENKPINDWDQLPREPSSKSVVYALKPNQRSEGRFLVPKEDADRLGVEVATLKSGDKFNGRLDIPAYQNYDTWIVAGTKAGEKGTTYAKAIHYTSGEGKPVRFLASQKMSEKIGKSEAEKTGYATISGYYKDSSPEELRILSERYLNDPEWSQVGFDPRRLGSFYLRKANDLVGDVGTPLGEADEVIQIGPLVLAKNAKAIEGYSGYNKGGVVTPMNFNKGGTPMLGKQMELFSDGGLKDQGGSVDEVSGNDVPVGSLKKEVRDDIPAKLSEGEFVLSADVVRFYGLSHIMAMRDKAKAGLAKMEAMGQMGNSTEATMEDDMPFSMEDLEVEDEEGNSLEYANGGFVRKFAEGGTPDPSIPPFSTPLPVPVAAPIGGYKPIFAGAPVEKKKLPTFAQVMPSPVTGQKQVKYVNAQGNVIDVWTDANGNPIYTVPEGYSPQATVPVAPSAPEVVAPTAPSVNKDGGGGGDKEKEAPAKKGTDWANITYKDLVEIGTEITSPAAKRAMGIFSAIPGIGLFAAAASTHQNSQLDKALVNQFLQPGLGGPEQDALSKIYTSNNSFLSRIFTDRPATLAEAAKGGVYKEPKVDKSVVAQAKEVSQGIATANLSASAVKLINTTATAAAEASTAAQVKRDGVAADYSPNGYSGTTVNNLVSTAGKISGVQQTGKVGILSGVVANDKDKDKNGNPTGTAARTTDTNRTVFSNADGSLYSKTGILGTKTVDVVKDPKTGQYKETGSDNNGGKEKADKSAVCTAFRNLGYLPDDIWALDDVFGKSLEKTNPTMVKGYRLWAVPVAKFIQTNTLPARTLRAIMWPITKAWAGEMAHKLKPENYKPNLSGKAIMFIGGSICSLIGYAHNMSCKQNGELV